MKLRAHWPTTALTASAVLCFFYSRTAYAAACQTYTQNPALYTTAKLGTVAASDIFCGNVRKYLNQSDNQNYPWCTNPMVPYGASCPAPWDPPAGNGCRANANVHGYPDRPFALEHAEIRGWVQDIQGRDDDEEEWKFNLVLDVGWTS